jgi:peptide deformylase
MNTRNNQWIVSLALVVVVVIARTRAFCHGPTTKPEAAVADGGNAVHDEYRREFLGAGGMMLLTIMPGSIRANNNAEYEDDDDSVVRRRDETTVRKNDIGIVRDTTTTATDHLRDRHDIPSPVVPPTTDWRGTSLPGPLSLSEACERLLLPPPLVVDSSSSSSSSSSGPPVLLLSMGRWPDPILRHPASNVPSSVFRDEDQLGRLVSVARALRNTARREGAVGLAAQQCGVDASLIYIDGANSATTTKSMRDDDGRKGEGVDALLFGDASPSIVGGGGALYGESNNYRRKSRVGVSDGGGGDYYARSSERPVRNGSRRSPRRGGDNGIYLVNPRIIRRSRESDMLVWTEGCLVLPPEFRATLLRDAEVTIEYESLLDDDDGDDNIMGLTKQITLRGELARCAQHEMDHDRGILIVDHVPLEELLLPSVDGGGKPRYYNMADIENADGSHSMRMQSAYSRDVVDSSLLPERRSSNNGISLAMEDNDGGIYHARVTQHEYPHFFVQAANAMDQEESNPSSPMMNNNGRQSKDRYGPSRNPVVTAEISSTCDTNCLEERKRVIERRRALMRQSRSNTRRGDVLELSQQRALMYGTGYRGLPPQLCSGFCP